MDGLKQVISFWVRVDLVVIAVKVYSIFLRAPGLEPHHQMQFSAIFRTLVAREGYFSSAKTEQYKIQFGPPNSVNSKALSRIYEKLFLARCVDGTDEEKARFLSRKVNVLKDESFSLLTSYSSPNSKGAELAVEVVYTDCVSAEG